jgi:hypothetical protein
MTEVAKIIEADLAMATARDRWRWPDAGGAATQAYVLPNTMKSLAPPGSDPLRSATRRVALGR